jgi:hypothetical protein
MHYEESISMVPRLPGELCCLLTTLVVCFELHEQFVSYLANVIITGDRAANLDLCLALTAFKPKKEICLFPGKKKENYGLVGWDF